MNLWKRRLPLLAILLLILLGFVRLQYAQHQQWIRLQEIQAGLQEIQEQVDQISREDTQTLQKQIDALQVQLDSIDTEASVSAEKTVYVTPSGSSYHEAGCRAISDSETLWERTETEAVTQGYSPCSICNP